MAKIVDIDFDDLTPEELEFFANLDLDKVTEDQFEAIEDMASFFDLDIPDPDPDWFPDLNFDIFEQDGEEELGELEMDDYLDELEETEDIGEFIVTGKQVCRDWETDRKSTRLNSSHSAKSRMPSSA